MKLLYNTISPYYTNIKLDINNNNNIFNEIVPNINNIPFLFKNELITVYLPINSEKLNNL